MSCADFSLHDVMFRRTVDDQCDIVVFGETVGTVMKRPDLASADPKRAHFYAAHLWDDARGPVLIDRREAVRPTIADMLLKRDLVPSTPPPVHPQFTERQHSAS